MRLRSELLDVFKLGGQIHHLLAIAKQTEATDVVTVPVPGHLMAGADIAGMQMQQVSNFYGKIVFVFLSYLMLIHLSIFCNRMGL